MKKAQKRPSHKFVNFIMKSVQTYAITRAILNAMTMLSGLILLKTDSMEKFSSLQLLL
jgi:hypothetical protein